MPWDGLLVVRMLLLILVNPRDLRNLQASSCNVVRGARGAGCLGRLMYAAVIN